MSPARQPRGTVPSPRIIDPPSGGHVRPAAAAAVRIDTNAPGLPHELVLLGGNDPSVELVRVTIPAGDGLPGVHHIPIPPDGDPGRPTDYYLAVGVLPEAAAEQQRHVVPVTTRPG